MSESSGENTAPRPVAISVTIWLGVIVIAGFIAYSPALDNDFVNWDDPAYLDTPLNWNFPANFVDFWTTPVAGNYHPLTMLTLAANYSVAGESPRAFILTNILIHLANSLLVFAFVWRLTDRRIWVAGITALFFALHPMHVESVAWIAERKDVLYSFFFLLALIAHLKHLESGEARDAGLTGAAFVLSLLAKPAAVVLPLCLVLIDFQRGRQFTLKRCVFYAPFFLASLAMGIVTLQTQRVDESMGAPAAFDFVSHCFFAAYGFIFYIVKMFVPLQQSVFIPYPTLGESGELPWIFSAAPFAVALVGAAAIYSLRHTRTIAFGLGFYLVTVVLVLNFVSVSHTLAAERYTYLPYVGLFFILGSGADRLAHAAGIQAFRWPVAALGLVLALLCAGLTHQRVQVWRNSRTLWSDVIEKFPLAATLPYASRAHHYRDMGNRDAALADYNTALDIDPEFVLGYVNRGAILANREEFANALSDFNRALALNEKSALALDQRGRLRLRTGNTKGALGDLEAALQLEPNGVRFFGRGLALLKLGQKAAAKRDFEEAERRNFAVEPAFMQAASR